MLNDSPTPAETRQALADLRALGISTVEIEFSGGNDEGGVDHIQFRDTEGNEVNDVPTADVYRDWQTKEMVIYASGNKRPATSEEIRISKIRSVLEAPIYDRYYTFAGEFYVDGTLTWDVTTGTHKMSGQESHEVWESFEEEVEV